MSSKKKSKKNLFIAIGIFCFLYIVLALRPLSTELHFSPQWTQSIFKAEKEGSPVNFYAENEISAASKNEINVEENQSENQSENQTDREKDIFIPFKLGQNLGYFSPDGKIYSRIAYPFKAAVSENFYCTYGSSNSKTPFFSPDGKFLGNIEEFGFPFFDKDKIFVFLPGGNSFALCGSDGKKIWTYESYAPITAFASSENGIAAGFSDGRIVSLSMDGKIDQNFAPGGSESEVILGCAISNDGKKLATVSGHKRQRFSVAENSKGHSRIIFHEFVPNETKHQVLVKFNEDQNLVYYGYKNGIGIVDLKKLKSRHIEIPGNIVQIEKSSVENMLFVLSRENSTYTVSAIESPYNKAAQFSFEASCAFIQTRGNELFVGRNDKISLMSISRK